MNLPQPGDYIDIHVHSGIPAEGNFIIESLMAHENKKPDDIHGAAYTFGIHPWFLKEENYNDHLTAVIRIAGDKNIIAIGEAGFDNLRGPLPDLQRKVFEAQVEISEAHRKPLIIHCVRAWDELLSEHKKIKPVMPWMIHGFRGKIQQARQLISKGFYLSIWFDFALRPESSDLMKNISRDKFFLETDGAEVDIRDIYKKVSIDMDITVEELKKQIFKNFNDFFTKFYESRSV